MEKLAVIGSGTMGHSIALNAAWSGLNVQLYGVSDSDVHRGIEDMMMKLATLHKNGLVAEEELVEIKKNIATTTSIENAVKEATFVIEAIPENIEMKKDLFRTLDELCKEDVILASNTSGLSPTEISSATSRPERVIVTHFWNPAHLIPLVEIVPGEKTDQTTVERSKQLIIKMNKKPIEVKKEVPGFVGNRLQYALFREALFLLEEGIATKEDIDTAVSYSIGRRLPVTGPLLSADMGGLDVFSAISDYLFGNLSNSEQSSDTLRNLVESRKLGSKTGEGFYDWDTTFSEEMNQKREKELIYFLKKDLKE
jgi:3-hydroxybutyryl-CoA dehydrogenase